MNREGGTRRIAMRIAYEGTAYAGWQRQENGPSIQQTIEDTVEDRKSVV